MVKHKGRLRSWIQEPVLLSFNLRSGADDRLNQKSSILSMSCQTRQQCAYLMVDAGHICHNELCEVVLLKGRVDTSLKTLVVRDNIPNVYG